MIGGDPLVFEAHYEADGSLGSAILAPQSDQDKDFYDSRDFSDLAAICGLSPAQQAYYLTSDFLLSTPIV